MHSDRRNGWVAIAVAASLGLLAASSSETAAETAAPLEAYVDTIALNVRAGPGTSNPIVGILLKYDPVSITGQQKVGRSTWYAIDAAGGYLDGWVSGRFLAFGPAPGTVAVDELDYGAPETPTLVRGEFKYLGVAGCRSCHVDSTGEYHRGAHAVWQGHLHAEAFRSLSRSYSLEIGERTRGIEDAASDWRCLKCHVTAYGAPPEQLARSYKESDGVGCEVCHGPGSAYAKADHGPSNPERYNLGFVKLTNLSEREQLCVKCHNRLSPTYKPFNVLAFSREIQHWVDPSDDTYFEHALATSRARDEALAAQPEAQAVEDMG